MASITDKITDTRNAARPNSALVTAPRSTGGTTLTCDNLVGWPTASKVHFVTYRIDSNSVPVPGTQLDCYGIVSGSNIGSFTVVDGTDTGNAVNDVVEMLPTAAWGQDLSDALTNQHTRVGAHQGITTDTITVTSGTTLPAGDIGTADLAAASVTADKLATGAQTAAVLTSETEASATYDDMTTPGPAVTVTIGANGLALVSIFCDQANDTIDAKTYMGFAISGATTVAASDNFAVSFQSAKAAAAYQGSATFLVTGLTAGSNTFTAKYRVSSGTGTFIRRKITVVPL